MCDSYARSLNAADTESQGDTVRIGVLDSVLDPVDDIKRAYDIDRTKNYVASGEPDTTHHGSDVFEGLSYFAPEATFDLHRVIAGNGKAKRGTLVDAIAAASHDSVDLLNLSIGVYHREEPDGSCGGDCRVADEARLASLDGTTVVAATGHRATDDPRAVHCPALLEETIGVGGFVARCRHELVDDTCSGQYWVREDCNVEGPFCGQRGCCPGQHCTDHRYEYPWRGNVSFHNAVPDVLAPVHHPVYDDGQALLQSGTSFGTPVVSGLLAAILSAVDDANEPGEAKRAVALGGADIDEGALPKFDGEKTLEILSRPG